MPHAYKWAVIWRIIKFLSPCIVLGIIAAWFTNQTALSDLHRFAPEEAEKLRYLPYYVALFVPILMGIFLIRFVFPISYVLTTNDLRKGGTKLYKWEEIESYTFENSTAGNGIRTLKIKLHNRNDFYFWPFDPREIREEQITQIFEEKMAPHRQELN